MKEQNRRAGTAATVVNLARSPLACNRYKMTLYKHSLISATPQPDCKPDNAYRQINSFPEHAKAAASGSLNKNSRQQAGCLNTVFTSTGRFEPRLRFGACF